MATLVCNSGSYTIVGASSVTARWLNCASGSYALTGTAATTRRGFSVVAASGSYTLTGSPINSNRISAAPAGYLIDGKDVQLFRGSRRLNVDSGSYAITGNTSLRLELAKYYDRGSYAVTGTAATLTWSNSRILAANSGSYTISSPGATLIYTFPGDIGEYLITGTAATLRRGKGLVAQTRSYAISPGPAVNLKWAHKFPSNPGSYAITGGIATLAYSSNTAKVIVASQGTYTVTGQAAGLSSTTRRIAADSGSYAITGIAAGLTNQFMPGAYLVTGTAAALRRTIIMAAAEGVYAIAGSAAGLNNVVEVVQGETGHYVIAGFSIPILARRYLVAEQGLYITTGADVFLRATRITASAGSYAITGSDATLSPSRTGRWRKSPTMSSTYAKQPRVSDHWDTQPPDAGVD